MRTHTAAAVLVASLAATLGAGVQDPIDRIREADIKADLFTLASDAMRGREAGTVDELTASAWIAERARAAGLQPAGDNGTYFQFFPIERLRISATSTVAFDGKTLAMGRDVVPDSAVVGAVDAPVTVAEGENVDGLTLKDRVLVVRYAPAEQPVQDASPRTVAAIRTWLRAIEQKVRASAPAAIVAIVPDAAQDQWNRVAIFLPRGSYTLNVDGAGPAPVAARGAPVLYVRESALGGPVERDARLVANISTERFEYPSVNIVAKVPGRDPRLEGEYVLFSAHQDHDGVRYAVKGDDIWNGADDNATTAVALLAIGRAFAARPGRRSALFVWHGAEERGLMGSRWYVTHPTVPLTAIVACLNGDMIGRNDPGTAALLGALPPHRNSPELVEIAIAANKAVSQFTVDSSWDDPNHREGWYYRSDHLPYARAGVPALFFTTLLHADYHTPFDNPDRIDVTKLTKMTRWMYATGRTVAETDKAPAADPSFKLERCRDSTGNYCAGGGRQ
jgi:Peptidase family M28